MRKFEVICEKYGLKFKPKTPGRGWKNSLYKHPECKLINDLTEKELEKETVKYAAKLFADNFGDQVGSFHIKDVDKFQRNKGKKEIDLADYPSIALDNIFFNLKQNTRLDLYCWVSFPSKITLDLLKMDAQTRNAYFEKRNFKLTKEEKLNWAFKKENNNRRIIEFFIRDLSILCAEIQKSRVISQFKKELKQMVLYQAKILLEEEAIREREATVWI